MSNVETQCQYAEVTGRVKWFNNKRGFGFITVISGENVGADVFAHHSAINAHDDQFLYLVQGEYVDFLLKPSDKSSNVSTEEGSVSHRWEAQSITGICGGLLMCETRNANRKSNEYSRYDADQDETQYAARRLEHPVTGLVGVDIDDDTYTYTDPHGVERACPPSRSYGRGRGRSRGRGRGNGYGQRGGGHFQQPYQYIDRRLYDYGLGGDYGDCYSGQY